MKNGVIELVKTDKGAVMPANTEFCGAVWRCPVCGGIIRRARGREIAEGLERWIAAGHGAVFITVTVRHQLGDPLAQLIDLMGDAWRRTVRGEPWKRIKQRTGWIGYTRTLEITYGHDANGWHPHYHFLAYLDKPANEQVAAYLQSQITERFSKFLAKAGAVAHLPDAVHGVDVRPVAANGAIGSLGKYVSKMASEMSAGDIKHGRLPAHLSPFQLLDITSKPWAVAAWREYVEATKGKRSIYYSRGMRDLLGLGDEKDDDAIIDEETQVEAEAVGAVSSDVWADVEASDAWHALDRALVAAARGDWVAAASELGVALGCMIDTDTGQQLPLLL